jgi:stage 0 sporulation regulatory protein
MGLHLNTLLKDIERCRREMVQLASDTSLSNDQVVEVSTKLDKLLNKYNHLMMTSQNA